MTKDNEDALRCAKRLERSVRGLERMHEIFGQQEPKNGIADRQRTAAAHLRRLVAENEAKDALLRQAVEALDNLTTYDSRPSSIWRYFYPSATGDYVNLREVKEKIDPAIIDIRQHLEGRA